jgi:hypothetical protein
MHLDDDLEPIVPLKPRPADLGDRWEKVDIDPFLDDVRDFAKKSDSKTFFKKHRGFYENVEKGYLSFVAKHPVVDWYETTFGAREGASYHVVPCQLMFPHNFGLRAKNTKGVESMYTLFSYVTDAKAKFPAQNLGDVALELLAHETGHSFVNPIVDASMSTFETSAAKLLAIEHDAMAKLAYTTTDILMRETVNRAVVLLYLSDRSTTTHRDGNMKEQVDKGFRWMPELVPALHAVRKKHEGKLPTSELVEATRKTLQAWADAH